VGGGQPNGWVPSLYIGTDGKLYASVFWHGDVGDVGVSPNAVDDGNWHQVVEVFNNGTQTLFLDGVAVASLSGLTQNPYSGSGYNYYLGVGYDSSWTNARGGWDYFAGALDNVAIYNTALNDNQVAAQYLAGVTPQSPVVKVHFNFGGFLPPLVANEQYQLGRVLPIKFQLTDFAGNPITALAAVQSIQVQQVTVSGQPLGAAFTPSSPGNTSLQNDGTQYHFNWQTKGLTAGFYDILVTLQDGSVQTIEIQLA
jgi:hypothetical protein